MGVGVMEKNEDWLLNEYEVFLVNDKNTLELRGDDCIILWMH